MNRYDQWCYTYLIGWRNLDVWYYGSRSANRVEPVDDLIKVYPTSSNYVKAFVGENGQPDIVKVHKLFHTRKEANYYEGRFLKRVNAVSSKRWLNRNDGKNFRGAEFISSETRRKISLANTGQRRTEETKEKIRNSQLGKKESREAVEKRKLSNAGQTHSQETREKIRLLKLGRKRGPPSEETRRKISLANKGKKRPREDR